MGTTIKTFCMACICILLSLPIIASAEHGAMPENAGRNINLPAGILPANTVHLSTPEEPAVDIKSADLSKVPDSTVRVTASAGDLSHPGALDELIASALKRSGKNRAETKTYTVKRGDSLWKIARKFSISISGLKSLNHLGIDKLKPGQKLLLEPEETGEDKRISEADLLELSKKSEVQEFDTKKNLIINALRMIDIPYKFGGTSFIGIDCSAFVQKVFSLINIQLPRTAKEQFTAGNLVKKENIDIGDILFFKTYASFPSHVGIYLGNNLFIHASQMAGRVMIEPLDSPYYAKRFIGAKRLL
ncbi:MAG: NlpC/P60 family protein [Nitrospirota bacterium]